FGRGLHGVRRASQLRGHGRADGSCAVVSGRPGAPNTRHRRFCEPPDSNRREAEAKMDWSMTGRPTRAPRVACMCLVEVRLAAGEAPEPEPVTILALSENISRGGVFVRTTSPPPVGQRAMLSIALGADEEVRVTANVVHVLTPEAARSLARSAG